ncbi:MAG: hypothetical protein HWN51_02140, partial [Desulfobacterales bacterium]|nr:hypothetical protein [Desulfobacterales bacterium]
MRHIYSFLIPIMLCTSAAIGQLAQGPASGAELPEKYSKVKIMISTEADIRTAQSADLTLGRAHYRDNQYSWSASTRSVGIAGVVNGYSDDWMYGEQALKNKIFAMTLEVGTSNYTLEFWPSQSKIYPFAQENVYPNLILALGPGVIDTESTLHAQNAHLNAHYLVPGLDTLSAAVEVVNPDSDSVSVLTIIEGMDHSSRDTIPMFDDGSHRDSTAGDGIYGTYWPVPIDEKNYTLHVYLRSEDLGIDHFSNDVARFTTVDPVVYDTLYFQADEPIPNPGDHILVYPTLRNNGSTAPATSVEATISSADPCVSGIARSNAVFADIPAGEAVTGANNFFIDISDDCPGGSDIKFALSIDRQGYPFWSDSFSVHVYPLGVAEGKSTLPEEYALHTAYPNPFNPVTTLRYDLPQRAEVRLTIYDI